MSSSQLNHPQVHSNEEEIKEQPPEESKENDTNLPNSPNNTSQPQTNILSHSPSNIPTNSLDWSSMKEFLHNDLHTHSLQSLFFLRLIKHIFHQLSPCTKISIILSSMGSIIIFISLPTQVIIGFTFLFIGLCGIISIIANKYIAFAQKHGLISLMKPGILKRFILEGSIVDIFWQIRNSKLGIPDFLLSQILPLDEPERQMIFERLPEITQNVVSTEGLIYLTPQAIQKVILPLHLQRSNNNNEDLSDLPRLSPITGSPNSSLSQSKSPIQRSLRDGIMLKNNHHKANDSLPSKVLDTKQEIASLGKNWLMKNQQINTDNSIESTSSHSSPNPDEKKDIFDENFNQPLLLTPDKKPNQVTIEEPDSTNAVVSPIAGGISWIGQVSKLLSGDGNTRNVVKAVIDTRMRELALQIISYVWKGPFSQINDVQLVVIFICCVGIVSFYLTKDKKVRDKFVKSMKYMGIMALFWIAILCFIELNIRRKSKLFSKIFDYINRQMFHSEQHKAVRERKKSFQLLNKTKSMRMYDAKSRKLRRLKYKDKRSKFSQTMPYLTRSNSVDNDSPKSNVSSSMSTESELKSEDGSSTLSPYSAHLMNKNNYKKSSLVGMPVNNDNMVRRRVSSFT